jgi:hypothetical protein
VVAGAAVRIGGSSVRDESRVTINYELIVVDLVMAALTPAAATICSSGSSNSKSLNTDCAVRNNDKKTAVQQYVIRAMQ